MTELTSRRAGQAKKPADRPGHPAPGQPEHRSFAVPPHEDELGAGRADPDEGGELEAEG